jgi:hypothetical protein
MKGRKVQAFTIAELLVSIAILSLVVIFLARVFTSAASVTTTGNKHMDCDLQARQVFDRMAVDLAQMIKRSDVDQYVKGLDPMKPGNDRIAFFSQVPGYSPTSANPSPISLVAYRINADNTSRSFNKMERMGKGLLWNGTSPTPTPPNDKSFMIFGTTPTLQTNWPGATTGDPSNASYKDPDYELVGPQVFRFEYYYILNDGTFAENPGAAGIPNVTAIAACIAVVDPKSKILISNDQLSTLAGSMTDFAAGMKPGELLTAWQAALDASTLPRPAVSAIRLYERYFYLFPKR